MMGVSVKLASGVYVSSLLVSVPVRATSRTTVQAGMPMAADGDAARPDFHIRAGRFRCPLPAPDTVILSEHGLMRQAATP